jgi:hypothetical protein
MSSSSLANWDGHQTTPNQKQSFNGDARTLNFSAPIGSITSTGTINNDRTGAYLDASLTSMDDHQAVWRAGEGNNQDVSSTARVLLAFFFAFPVKSGLTPRWTRSDVFSPSQIAARTSLSTVSHLATNVNVCA